jgi:hypothetical protein
MFAFRTTGWSMVVGAGLLWGSGAAVRGQDPTKTKPAASPESPQKGDQGKESPWKPLFDGKSLTGWKTTAFGGQGTVEIEDGSIILGFGSSLTGITYQGEFPKCNYEIQFEGRRLDGVDFFSTLTFPVGDSFCSLVVGGWGGGVVGISCLNGDDASMNETTGHMKFTKGQWYRIRVEVRPQRIRAWVDDKRVVDVDISHHKLATRYEVRLSEPLGIASWETRGAVRAIEYRLLEPERPADAQQPNKTETPKRGGNP